MSMTFISTKCPECKALMNIEEGRKSVYCSYCGYKILINNENEHVVRTINEAKIKYSEVYEAVRLKELEMEEKREKRKRNGRIAGLFIAIALLITGIILCYKGPILGVGLFVISISILAGILSVTVGR